MRRVRRHTEKNNILLLAKILKFDGAVALMAVDNQQSIPTHSMPLCMGIKVLQPGKSKLIIRPAIRTDFKNPVGRQIFKPDVDKHLARKDDEGWYLLTGRAYALDRSNPLPVAWLYPLLSTISL